MTRDNVICKVRDYDDYTYLCVWFWSSPARCRWAAGLWTSLTVVRRGPAVRRRRRRRRSYYAPPSIPVCRQCCAPSASWGGCRTRGDATCPRPPPALPVTTARFRRRRRWPRPPRRTGPPAAFCCCSPSSSTFHTDRVTPVRTSEVATADDGWR